MLPPAGVETTCAVIAVVAITSNIIKKIIFFIYIIWMHLEFQGGCKGTAKKQIKLYRYPLQSESNDYLKIDSIIPQNAQPKVTLIVKIQLYKLSQAGVAEQRIPLIGAIARINTSGSTPTVDYDLYDNVGTYSLIPEGLEFKNSPLDAIKLTFLFDLFFFFVKHL